MNIMHGSGQGYRQITSFDWVSKVKFLFSGSILIWVLTICSCQSTNEESTTEIRSSFDVSITHRAGDDFEEVIKNDTFRYMNYPFSIGKFRNIKSKSVHCIILSKKLGRKNRVQIHPIALLQLEEFGNTVNYVIGIPVDKNKQSVDVFKYSDFVLAYSPIKSIIQTWLENRCGMGCTELIGWNDEHFAELFLEKST